MDAIRSASNKVTKEFLVNILVMDPPFLYQVPREWS